VYGGAAQEAGEAQAGGEVGVILYFLRRYASGFAILAGLIVYRLLLPEDWGLWFRLPLAMAVAIGVVTLLSRPPAKRY
jgi:hypothetical protein